MSEQFVELNLDGRAIRIECAWIAAEHKDRPLIVILHEGLGSVAMWKDFPQRLCDAGKLRGLVYSRPGYGRSTPRAPDEHWGVDYLHRQAHEVLPALLAALGMGPASPPPWLFGHSDGGSIALLYAARFPGAVTGIVALAPHLFVEPISVRSIEAVRRAYLETDLRERLARYHDDVDSTFWGWNDIWLDPSFWNLSIADSLQPIRCPVLAVQGEDDEHGTMAQIEAIARVLPQARLLKLAACRHSAHRDQPEAVLDAVTAFVNQISGRDRGVAAAA